MYKKIISLLLVIATLCSFLVVPASAEDILPPVDEDYGGFISGVVDFADWAIDETFYAIKLIGSVFSDEICPERAGSNDTHSFVADTVMVDGVLGNYYVCQYCGFNSGYTADAHGFNSAYDQYVSSLQTDLGGTVLSNGAIRYYFTCNTLYRTNGYAAVPGTRGKITTIENWLVPTVSERICAGFVYLAHEEGAVVAPTDGSYSTGVIAPGLTILGTSVENRNVTSGTVLYPSMDGSSFSMYRYFKAENMKDVFFSTSIIAYADFTPLNGISSLTGQDITINSRPTSIVGDYGIIGDDGTIIHVEGNMIVDESTNVVYNPVTNNTYNYTDYAFDYSDRSYNLTLEDGSTLKVVYGDENVTIQEGDTIYNIYYLIPDDSGSGDDPGSGDIPGGEDMSWWKEAWTNFTDKLFSILGNGGSSVNPDTAPAVPDDEETGEKGYSVIDLFVVLKDGTWAFITGIVSTAYDGFTGFVESVSSAGSFFTFYDEESEDGILFVPLEGGETIWD